jgi:Arc-like DNA binding domain
MAEEGDEQDEILTGPNGVVLRRLPDYVVNLKLRLPEGLRQQLENAAKVSNQSMNREINDRLALTFTPEWAGLVAAVRERKRQELEREEDVKERAFELLLSDPRLSEAIDAIAKEVAPDHQAYYRDFLARKVEDLRTREVVPERVQFQFKRVKRRILKKPTKAPIAE